MESIHSRGDVSSDHGHFGYQIGGYDLIARIARGGMATVYLCQKAASTGFQRLFAMKILHPHLAQEEDFVRMLLDEARIAARVHHPNVVGIVDLGAGEPQGNYFIVMEYVEGCSLIQLLKRQPQKRPPRLIVPTLIDVLNGLQAAHTLRADDGMPLHLIHRDVSPHNILIGTEGAARLTDFGVAKAASRITQTLPGIRKGKLAYMSPEQVRGVSLDCRSDLFSIGVVMWNALTGNTLFHGESDAGIIRALLHQTVPRPSTEGLQPPACLDEICLRALSKNPADRFASASEMAEDLRDVALRHNLLGAPKEVAAWIFDVFGATLESRRRAVREALHWRLNASGSHPIGSTVTGSFPVLSSVGSWPLPPSERTDPSRIPFLFAKRQQILWGACLVLAFIGAGAAVWMSYGEKGAAVPKASQGTSVPIMDEIRGHRQTSDSLKLPSRRHLLLPATPSINRFDLPDSAENVEDEIRARATKRRETPRRRHSGRRARRTDGVRTTQRSSSSEPPPTLTDPNLDSGAETGSAIAYPSSEDGIPRAKRTTEGPSRLEPNPYIRRSQ